MDDLVIRSRPPVRRPAMVLGLTGWMDGGSVSTGTVSYLVDRLGAEPFGEIRPLDFYILHFPISTIPISIRTEEGQAVLSPVNPMEMAAIFRPHARIEDGLITELTYPQNQFFCSERGNVILFIGEEPHIRWGAFLECLFRVAEEFEVEEIYSVGSVAAPIPHTREPRLRATVSGEELKAKLASLDLGYSGYQGPASIITALSHDCPERGLAMRSLVVEVPHYPFVQMPAYPRSILRTTSALNDLLGLGLDLGDLRRSTAVVEEKLNAAVEENETFRELVVKLEEAYDREGLDSDAELLKRLVDGIDLGGEEESP